MSTDRPSGDKSAELQAEIDRLSEKLGVRSMPVGMRSKDDLNIFVDDQGAYHFAFYERGQLGFDQVGSLDDLLYWYCQSIVSSQSAKRVGDRRDRFKYEYDWLSEFSIDWAKRNVRETAAMFRRYDKAQDVALLPDISEAL
jgi:hypothetical protein